MIIKTKALKNICSNILVAIDTSELNEFKDKLQLIEKDNSLFLIVGSRDYNVTYKLPLDTTSMNESEGNPFNAIVSATTFLKLVSSFTTEDIEFATGDNALKLKANGTYKLPLIEVEIPTIKIDNKTIELDVDGDILYGILQYNTPELEKNVLADPIQNLYYLDEKGCITFTSGATINNFTLPQPIKLFLDKRTVKLFKLLKGKKVHLNLGYDAYNEATIQTKLELITDDTKIISLLPGNDEFFLKFPTDKLRTFITKSYSNSITVDKDLLVDALDRLLIFKDKSSAYNAGEIKFTSDNMILSFNNNSETVELEEGSRVENEYTMLISFNTIQSIIESCSDKYLTFNFGDNRSLVITRKSGIINAVPEMMKR